ncbi:MAG: ABC transporter permease [Acidobacteria bacterium]|nr:MAG: ABC transporter permease [Acidobacteriota bacterium]PYS82146.1 MAG: ABC transporter permease [Acidobacteriota bacterium]
MKTLLQDLRYGLRMLLKNPGFTAVAVIALALGIGANSAIFSVVNSLLLRPLPFEQPGRLVQVWEANPQRGQTEVPASFPNFADWRDQNHVFEQMVAYSDWSFNLTGAAEPERIRSAIVSPTFFSTLGIKPILGRTLLPDEDQPGKDLSVVISQRLWQRRFNSDPNVVGKTVDLNGKSFTVVGVIAQTADLPGLSDDTELWAPVSQGFGFTNRRGHYLNVIARLKPGVGEAQAQADMNQIAAALSRQYPEANADRGVRIVPLQEQVVGDVRLALLVLLGAVVFVLLIASTNVANMLLARASSRRKEIAIRTALGAGRWRLIRQLLTESLLLALAGGTLGLLLALWGVDLLVAFGPSDLPRVKEVAMDGRVLAFTFAVSLATGLVFGLVPALQSSRPELNETLKEGGRSATGGASRRRVRSLLVVTEIALSLVLLVGAGLLLKSFFRLRAVNPGFNPQDVLTMQLDLHGPNYQKGAQLTAFHDQLLDRVKALPGVEAVATASAVPVAPDAGFWHLSFAIEGQTPDPANRPVAFYNGVSPDYFRTMQIPVLRGRVFDEHDVKKAQGVVIINETLARKYFPGADPVGQRITLSDENPKEEDWATIIAVVKDTKPRELSGEPVAEMYMPYAQQPEVNMALMIRTTGRPDAVAAAVRREVLALDHDQPVYSVRTLPAVMSEAVATPRFRTSLLGLFAALALVLAVVGIYGVMSYAVAQRTHEFGIRMALGAQGRDVLKLVVGYGMALALAGVLIGLAASFALTRVMSGLLYGVAPTDPVTFACISLLLLAVALAACLVPARRAAKVDPMVALRYE